MLPVPAFPDEADRVAVEAGGDEACTAEQADNSHQSHALPFECRCGEDSQIQQNDGDLRECHEECIQELLNVEVLHTINC